MTETDADATIFMKKKVLKGLAGIMHHGLVSRLIRCLVIWTKVKCVNDRKRGSDKGTNIKIVLNH